MAFQNAELVHLKEHALILRIRSKTELGILKSNQERIEAIIKDVYGKALHLSFELLEQEAPTKVDIPRKTIDDIKQENPELAKFIEQTESRLI